MQIGRAEYCEYDVEKKATVKKAIKNWAQYEKTTTRVSANIALVLNGQSRQQVHKCTTPKIKCHFIETELYGRKNAYKYCVYGRSARALTLVHVNTKSHTDKNPKDHRSSLTYNAHRNAPEMEA